MGDFNLTVILDTIRRAKNGLSRVELAALVGLSPQTISNITRRLLDQELIVEAGKAGSGPGKPRTILRLNPTGMYAMGVHIDPAMISFALLDLVGNIAHSSKVPTPHDGEPSSVMAAIIIEVQRIIDESGVDPEKITGLGVASPGPIDIETGAVVNPPLIQGWPRVLLRDTLAKSLKMNVVMDKDVTAAAVGETWIAQDRAVGNFAVFYMGTGIGCGVVLNDEVFRGSSGNAGEMGHIIVNPDGPLCDCGKHGCVKSTVIPRRLVDRAAAQGLFEALPESANGSEVQQRFLQLCTLAEQGNEAARTIIYDSAQDLSKAVSAISNVLDLDRVVFGGPFWPHLEPFYMEVLPRLLTEGADAAEIHVPEVVSSAVGENVGVVGAACLVLEAALAPRSERLMLNA